MFASKESLINARDAPLSGADSDLVVIRNVGGVMRGSPMLTVPFASELTEKALSRFLLRFRGTPHRRMRCSSDLEIFCELVANGNLGSGPGVAGTTCSA